jgi:hypothetical protein
MAFLLWHIMKCNNTAGGERGGRSSRRRKKGEKGCEPLIGHFLARMLASRRIRLQSWCEPRGQADVLP